MMRNNIVSDSSDEEEEEPPRKSGPKSRRIIRNIQSKKSIQCSRASSAPQSQLSQSQSQGSADEEEPPRKLGPKSKRISRNLQSQKFTRHSVSQSELSQTQSFSQSHSQDSDDESELQRLAYLCANLFLVSNCKKVPIKRSEIGKLVPKEYSRRGGDIINRATGILEEILGYKPAELDKKGVYILVNALDLTDLARELPLQIQEHEAAILNLRTHILVIILMSEGVIQEATLDEFVRHLGINAKENHPLLGNVQKLIYQDFVRQGFLEVICHKNLDTPFKDIRWGPRAKIEMDQRDVIKFVCKVYGDTMAPEMWVEQWKRATEDARGSL